jgi:nitrous oxidase accessory protein
MIKILLFSFTFIFTVHANILQETIDKSPAGSTLKLSSGIYNGKLIINKPMTIIGKEDGVVIKGDGTGKVITINSSSVILKNLLITGSGNRMENLDAAIAMNNVKNCEISHCQILDSLYGIDMNRVEGSTISNNYITSKENEISLRGNALKIWYSSHNIIKNNTIERSRDITLTYASHNMIEGNTFLHNRFALHLSKSHQNRISNNTFKYNSVGILLMGVKDINVTNNLIQSSKGAAGIGVIADKVSNFLFEGNQVKYNAKALYIDTRRVEREYQRFIKNNQILYNGEALHFHSSIKNNVITHNFINGNMDDVIKDTRDGYTTHNLIEYNYWDRYAGFDRDGDNIGDTTHKNFQYADQLWHYDHKVKFFYGSPVMSLINFLSQLAPFIEPVMLLEDKKPLIHP